ncbi:na+ dependent nucleoside transporter family protein, partial [Clostridioides difficile CD9]
MYLAVNVIGIIVFLGVAVLFSKDRKHIDWKSVGIMVVINIVLAWFLV